MREDNAPINRDLEAHKPDNPFSMQVRDRTNRKTWGHLLDDTTDDWEEEVEHANAKGPLFDTPPMDILPKEYLKNPEDPNCLLDDELAYERGVCDHVEGRQLVDWSKQRADAVRDWSAEDDPQVTKDAKSWTRK